MKARTTIILAVIAVVLVAIAVVSNRTERGRETLDSGPIFPGLQADAVAEIRIASSADTVGLVKESDTWIVATEGDYRADPKAIERLLEKLDLFDRKHLRSTNPEMQKTFEVDDSSGTEVLLAGAGGTLAHFRMGKSGPDFRSQYVRPEGSSDVFLIPDFLRTTFDAGRTTWRDQTIFSFDQEKVKRILIQPEEKDAVEIVKDDEGNYVMTAPDSAAVTKTLIESTVRTLSTLRCDAFPDSVPSPEDAGLEPPRQRIEAHLDDGASHALNVGNQTDTARHYVKKDGDETIFFLSKGRVNGLMRDAETLKEAPPKPPEEEEPSE